MTLKLSRHGIVDSRAIDKIPKGDDVLAEIEAELASKGIYLIQPPSGEPPQSLTELDATNLSMLDLESLYAKYTAYTAFIESEFTACEVRYRYCESALKQIRAHVEAALLRAGVPKSEVPSKRDLDPEVEEATRALLKARAKKSLVSSAMKAYAKQAAALSRIVEIRKMEFDQVGRSRNLNYDSNSFRTKIINQTPSRKNDVNRVRMQRSKLDE